MEKEIAALKSDVAHIKDDTTEIKQNIAAFVAHSAKMSVDIEGLRGRLRECEHEIIAMRGDVNNQRGLIWKFGTLLALVASGVSVGVQEIFR